MEADTVHQVLQKERKKFLPNFKNPCWYDFTGNNSSNRLRCLPYFHIIGVCKSGTTDLFYRLVQHPQIVKNRGLMSKETWFWSWHRYGTELWRKVNPKKFKNLDNFLDFFQIPKISEFKVSSNGSRYSEIITGHADPMDFWDHTLWWLIPQNNGNASEPVFTTPHLIHHVQPNIKLILLLREPAERLYSHYYHLGYGSSPEDFKVDVSASIRYLDRCRAKSSLRSCLYNRTLFKEMPTPLFASFYDVHMANWLEVFPRNQIFIMRTEDFDKSKKKYLLQLFKFLNVGDVEERVLDRMSNLAHKYKSVRKDKAGPMLNHTRQTLRDYLREPMKRLASLLHDEKYTWDDIYIGN
ncbi:carbohydrate sulfotransferase 15 isoform X3 [Magallana gigas]|uniref:carbohydrate sulfotransferase 15 isoform X3 n=1 Tax=Magallana gigas TaxID=29159 RepID=UPI00333E9280